jgi:hypothetical protein
MIVGMALSGVGAAIGELTGLAGYANICSRATNNAADLVQTR